MKRKIAVAISGGVDSLTTAYLLKNQGYHVIGLHFLTGYEQLNLPSSFSHNLDADPSQIIEAPKSHPISKIADQLQIPVFIIDCTHLFKIKIVDYFIKDYMSGRTPNPCMVCNPTIKFGVLLDIAHSTGATHLATGHYARVEKFEDKNLYKLKKGTDPEKDQSYFLSMLSQKQLSNACFPLGKMTKKQVIKLAQQEGLTPVTKSESQDVCFIKNIDYTRFLSSQEKFIDSSGPIKNTRGEILGHHNGLHRYTVGQRNGINCPGPAPYYVLKIDVQENTLLVGFKDELYKSELSLSNVNWISPRQDLTTKVFTRIRYRHEGVESTLIPIKKNTAIIKFDRPQPAVAPGQAAVCYYGDEVVASGFIDE